MSNQAFTIERVFDAPIEKVWKAISDKDEMKNWYFDLQEFRPEIGFEFSFPGQGHNCEEYIHLCKITEVIVNKKLCYSWQYKDHEGFSQVCFELFEEQGQTRLKLTHAGLESFPTDNSDFARSSFEAGWTEIIGTNLKNYLEK